MANFLKIGANGLLAEEVTVTTGGVGNANKVPQLDANGQLTESMMPTGIGADTAVYPSSENLSAGDQVNIYNNAGTLTCRKADAGTNNYASHGYVKAAVTSPANATIYFDGACPGTFTATDTGKPVFLSATAGATTLTPVSGTGKIHQQIGTVISLTVFDFEPQPPIVLA